MDNEDQKKDNKQVTTPKAPVMSVALVNMLNASKK